MVRYGFCSADESHYFATAQRFVLGDRPIVDEWGLQQIPCLFLCLPYKLFTALTGSSDGVVLFMRYLFLIFNAVFYWFMYIRLRAYKWIDLAATLLFSTYVPFLFFSCNYYTVPVRLLMVICLVLFAEKQSPASLLAAGILFSCSVLNQPSLALLYFGYSALVWMRFFRQKKGKHFLDKYSFCLNVRAWKHITVGVCVCAAIFLAWLFARGGLMNVLRSVPLWLFTDPEFDLSAGGNVRGLFVKKLSEAIDVYGPVCLVCAAVVVALSIAYACGRFSSRRKEIKKIIFCFACASWMLSCASSFRLLGGEMPYSAFSMYPAPLFWFGIVCFLLCEQKNNRFLLFSVVSLCSSLCIDLLSGNGLSLGSPIAYISDLVFFSDLIIEFRTEGLSKANDKAHKNLDPKPENRSALIIRWCKRLTCCCFAAWFASILFFENTAFPEYFSFGTPLFSLPYVCTEGPLRSLHVSQSIGEDYSRQLADIDTIKETQPKNLYVCGLAPTLYLYADLPFATYCAWSDRETPYLDRELLYWELHPERLPACIYIPSDHTYNDHGSAEGQLDWIHNAFDPLCEYTTEQGQGGYILYVSQWHLPETTE